METRALVIYGMMPKTHKLFFFWPGEGIRVMGKEGERIERKGRKKLLNLMFLHWLLCRQCQKNNSHYSQTSLT